MKNLVIALTLIICLSCTHRQESDNQSSGLNSQDSAMGMIVADTVIYDVSITNHNPDDTWSEQRLKGLNRELMLNNIFTMISNGSAVAYNHTTGEKLTPKQVEKMEMNKEFNRSMIDMIQFKEVWYMNPGHASVTKKVISMVLGSQVFDSYGSFVGNKAVLRIDLVKL